MPSGRLHLCARERVERRAVRVGQSGQARARGGVVRIGLAPAQRVRNDRGLIAGRGEAAVAHEAAQQVGVTCLPSVRAVFPELVDAGLGEEGELARAEAREVILVGADHLELLCSLPVRFRLRAVVVVTSIYAT
jgi:hypothetical protein